jgi:hypothetical protein
MDDGKLVRQLLENLQPPAMVVPPLNVNATGKVGSHQIDNVYYEAAIALVLGEDLTETATSWKESYNHFTENWICLYLLILAVEWKEYGSFFIDCPRGENEQSITYHNTVKALARRFMGIPEPGDDKIIKRHVVPSQFINVYHLMDVEKAIKDIIEDSKADTGGSKKKKAKVPDLPKISTEVTESFAEFEAAFRFPSLVETVVFTEAREVEASDLIPVPRDLNNPVVNKVTFTVAPCLNVEKEVVGYLIRFLVHDSKWNPGRIVYDLINQIATRDKNRGNQTFQDPWPHYKHLFGTSFPVFSMSWAKWMQCCHKSTGERPGFEEMQQQLGQIHRADDRSSPYHPYSVCSLDKAVQRLRAKGAVIDDRTCLEERTATWTKDYCQPYRYSPAQVFWDSDKEIGLYYQNLPGQQTHQYENNSELIGLLKSSQVVTREEVQVHLPRFSAYRTNNMFLHTAVEADAYQGKLMMLFKDDYEEYCRQLRATNGLFMKKFVTISSCVGNIDDLPISHAGRSILKWFKTIEKDPFTIETELSDGQMSFFGNYVVRQLLYMEKFERHVQPVIAYKLGFLCSVYQRRKGFGYNMMLVGAPQGGKSHGGIDFAEKTYIPGTTKQIDRITGAGDQTDMSVHDEIRLSHEADEELLDTKSKANRGKLNLKKSVMGSGRTTTRTLEYVNVPGYGKMRGAREATQGSDYVECVASNHPPSRDSEIGNRWHIQMYGQSSIPTEELDYTVEPIEQKLFVNSFRRYQFTSFLFEKAAMCYAIPCRGPYMGLFNDISARMMEIMKMWDAVDERGGKRAIEIMRNAARKIAIDKAALYTFHVRGAKHYGKPFRHEYVADMAPVAYCDSEDTLLTWTLHSSDIIRSEYENVLKAGCRVVLNRDFDTSKTPYYYYENDTEGRISFKTDRNTLQSKQEQGRLNTEVVDLNYFQIKGKHEEIFRAISAQTSPHLEPSEVASLMEEMGNRSFRPRIGENQRNGYEKYQPADDLKSRHRMVMDQKITLSRRQYPSALGRFSIMIASTVDVEILQRLDGLNPNSYRIPDDGKNMLNSFTNLEKLFLFFDKTWSSTLENLRSTVTAMNLYKLEDRFSREDMMEVLSAFTDVTLELVRDPFKEVATLTYPEVVLIRAGIQLGWIWTVRDTDTVFKRPQIIREQGKYDRFASEDDLNMLQNNPISTLESSGFIPQTITVVDLSRRDRICFSPMAIHLFDQNIILDAFFVATLCSSTRPGRRLLGWTHPDDPTKMQTFHVSPEFIRQKTEELNESLKDDRAVLRDEGVVFKRRGFIEKASLKFIYGNRVPEHAKNTLNIEVIANLDRHAAETQAKLCGSEIVYDYDYILKQYLKAGGTRGDVTYPDDIIQEKISRAENYWKPNTVTRRLLK